MEIDIYQMLSIVCITLLIALLRDHTTQKKRIDLLTEEVEALKEKVKQALSKFEIIQVLPQHPLWVIRELVSFLVLV